MSLRPRHYVLLAIVLGLFLFNIVRHRRDQRNLTSTSTTPAPVVVTKPRLDTPAWAAYDHAAALRDDPPATYEPAIQDLQKLLPLDPNQNDGHLQDIHDCLTWLGVYRQGAAQSQSNHSIKAIAAHHIDNCVKYHQDTSA